MSKYLVLFFSFFSIFSCTSHQKVDSPERVKGIPENAFWVGGEDGGNWYLFHSIDSIKKQAFITVYHDHSGERLVSKLFKVDCINEGGIKWNNLKSQIMGFDGNKIILHIRDSKNSKRNCYFD